MNAHESAGAEPHCIELRIPSDVRHIEHVVETVRRECAAWGLAQQYLALHVPVALTEALSNAILRGNREDPAKDVHVRACVDAVTLVIEVRDQGRGFDIDAAVDPTTPDQLEREDGRGIFLMRKLMHDVERLDVVGGSVVRLTLHHG